jgi:hypothetical protein
MNFYDESLISVNLECLPLLAVQEKKLSSHVDYVLLKTVGLLYFRPRG